MEWKIVKLGEVSSILGDGIHGTPVYDAHGTYYFINGNNLDNGRILLKGDTKKVDRNEYIKHKKDLTDRTILISINGTLGNTAKYNGEPCILGKSACYFNVLPEYDKDFIYYVVTNSKFRTDLEQMATGTTIKNVSLKSLREYKFAVPVAIHDQHRIAAILSSLDDKIENNNRINRNLEAQAQALFKSWFVDFEPWGGIMPDDWKEGTLGELCSFNKRKVGPKFANPIQYLDTGHLTEGVIEGYQRFNPGDKIPSSARRYVGEGDILFSLCRPNMRHYGLMIDPPSDIVASTGFAVITANWSGYRYYIYQWLKQDGIIDNIHAVAEQSSTTYPTIDVDYLAGMNMVIPSIEDTEKYAHLCRDLYSKMESNYQENQRLATLRDSLLPKLMKGEIEL